MKPIKVEWIKKDQFRLLEDREYHVTWSIKPIVVPKGFITDFASVPRFLWAIIPFSGPWNNAAILHDYIYVKKLVARNIGDDEFYAIMKRDKVPRITAWLMYKAVKWFGKKAYEHESFQKDI